VHLTDGQKQVVQVLYMFRGALTARELSESLNIRRVEWTPDRASAVVRRLRNRDIVLASKTRPTRYRLSPEARQAYAKDLKKP
jgi:sugar-specific transcriptional regulator TrmB